ncbi:MAG: 1-(5-phosphoribosyl)-5-((5-phosphoribosylamino)methylideneamino)imidazole-4-carboxamide isomerase [Gemmatimonadetes bacterium]|nr:1-(5-phosphoribosyl)-5-((5-phosphoribosylamino)methylideneamino)imidazole-4-carboxamide isomerase [Gemmatimonadota bacterium]
MQIYPAIDITRGKAAHLFQGVTDDPLAIAERFLADGGGWLHLVDLDRAFQTGGDNTSAIRTIARLPGARVQLGGLLRTVEEVERGIDAGASRVVVATAALLDLPLLRSLLQAAGTGRLATAIDVRQGRPVLRGTTGPLQETAPDLAVRAQEAGVQTILYRDLDRDGQLAGLDLAGAAALLPLGADVIVAGGGSSLEELGAARAAGLRGAVVGRALYEGRFTVAEAIACSR